MNETRKKNRLEDVFVKQKTQALSGVDLSRKGSIDAHVLKLVAIINEQAKYFTTSSCSGRILVFLQNENEGKIKKRNCEWLLTTHDLIDDLDGFVTQIQAKLDEVLNTEKDPEHDLGVAFLKFEPMVLHVQCKDLESAQLLHTAGIESGFKNSGLSIGKKGKIISAIRSTHALDVPLTDHDATLLVDEAYLRFITSLANNKLSANFVAIERLLQNVSQAFVRGGITS